MKKNRHTWAACVRASNIRIL